MELEESNSNINYLSSGESIVSQLFFNFFSHQDLKMAQWETLFTDTYDKCKKHLGNAGHAYFGLLASQICQRLVKAVGGGAKPGPEHSKEMFSKLHTITPDGTGPENEETVEYKVVFAVKSILDIKSPPDAVLKAGELFDKTSELHEHWLIKAMSLDRGRKLLEMALQNAKSRETQAGVLGLIADAAGNLEKAGLLDETALKKPDAGVAFTAEYGGVVAAAEKVLHDPGARLQGHL